MKAKRVLTDFEISLLPCVLLYLVLAIIIYPHYKYQLNPDGISYMSIAQKYALHDFSNAINGYWGPLISWLMVPFLAIGFESMGAANLLILIIGLIVVIQSYLIIKLLNISILLRYIVTSLISVIVIFFAFFTITPDLLFVSFSLAFIIKILDSSLSNSRYGGLLCGLIGSGLYLTKSFGFPFFITSYLTVSLILYLRTGNLHDRRRIVVNYFSGMLVFLLISGVWVSLISHKYGRLTIGTAGVYNRVLSETNSQGHPMFYAGLIDPPNKSAISIWEDVGSMELKSWNIFDSSDTLAREFRIFNRNIRRIINHLLEFSFLSIPLLVIALCCLVEKGRQFVFDSLLYLLLILAILIVGYAMIGVDPRYLWLSYIITVIIGAKLLGLLFDKIVLKNFSKVILTGLFVIGFLAFPLNSMYHSFDNGKSTYELSNRINKLNIAGKIASAGDWEYSLYLSFHNGWQYYGQSGDHEESWLENELKTKMIDYYFVWEPYEKKLKFLDKYQEITGETIEGLRIYRLK